MNEYEIVSRVGPFLLNSLTIFDGVSSLLIRVDSNIGLNWLVVLTNMK